MGFGYDRREFERHCDELIESLPIPTPFEVTAFLGELSRQRPTPVVLWRMNPVQVLPVGMLVSTTEQDYVFVVRGTPAGHVRHILFHEIGHLMLGHTCGRSLGTRCSADQRVEEREAELFAYRLTARVRVEERRHALRGSGRPLVSAFGARRQLCSTSG